MANKLIVPIQINGNMDQTVAPNKLLERELFINKEGYVYYGTKNGDSVGEVKVKKADHADTSHSTNTIGTTKLDGSKYETPIYINIGGSSRIGYVPINSTITDNTNTWSGYNETLNVRTVLDNFRLTNVDILTASKAMYGDKLPTTAKPGQIFFRI